MKLSHNASMVSKNDLEATATNLAGYRARLSEISDKRDYADPECSIQLPFDEELLSRVRKLAETVRTPTLQYVVVIGIGGSNLGTKAIYDAIVGSMNLLVDRLPKLLFLDTVSDERMTAISQKLKNMPSKDDFAIVSVSKSGGTTEVIANTETLWHRMDEHFGDIKNRIVVITNEDSKMWKVAKKRKIHRLAIPELVGGRYSVLSVVGLLPLQLANINIERIRDGAKKAVKDGVHEELKTNLSIVSAILTHYHSQKGRTIHNSFLFTPKLSALGKWYRQLMGESIGKEHDIEGKTVHSGITPIVSIGSTDLHSMAQLYYGGPDDKFTNILYSFKGDINLVPQNLKLPGLVSDIQGKSLEDLMEAIVGGFKQDYETHKRPYLEIDLQGITPFELGYYLQFRMIEMMYLAKLMNVNAFDQPAVETYKEATRKLLKG